MIFSLFAYTQKKKDQATTELQKISCHAVIAEKIPVPHRDVISNCPRAVPIFMKNTSVVVFVAMKSALKLNL